MLEQLPWTSSVWPPFSQHLVKLKFQAMCASTTLHAFILIPCSCQQTPPEHDGGELPGPTEKFPNSLFPRIQGVSCLLDSYLSQAWSDVWVVVDVKLYLFNQVWSGMKPWFTELSLSYAALQKHQLLHLHLEKQKTGWRHLLAGSGSSEAATPARDVKEKLSVPSGTKG